MVQITLNNGLMRDFKLLNTKFTHIIIGNTNFYYEIYSFVHKTLLKRLVAADIESQLIYYILLQNLISINWDTRYIG